MVDEQGRGGEESSKIRGVRKDFGHENKARRYFNKNANLKI